MWSTPSLPLLKRPFWPGEGAPERVLSMGQVQLFKILKLLMLLKDSWKFTMLLLYILWDDWPIFMFSGSNQQIQQQLEYTQLKPDCHNRWIPKMQSDTLEERYAKFCFKLAKNATETYGILQTTFRPSCMNQASVLSSIRESIKARSLWAMMRGVGEVRKSIHQSW